MQIRQVKLKQSITNTYENHARQKYVDTRTHLSNYLLLIILRLLHHQVLKKHQSMRLDLYSLINPLVELS